MYCKNAEKMCGMFFVQIDFLCFLSRWRIGLLLLGQLLLLYYVSNIILLPLEFVKPM